MQVGHNCFWRKTDAQYPLNLLALALGLYPPPPQRMSKRTPPRLGRGDGHYRGAGLCLQALTEYIIERLLLRDRVGPQYDPPPITADDSSRESGGGDLASEGGCGSTATPVTSGGSGKTLPPEERVKRHRVPKDVKKVRAGMFFCSFGWCGPLPLKSYKSTDLLSYPTGCWCQRVAKFRRLPHDLLLTTAPTSTCIGWAIRSTCASYRSVDVLFVFLI